MIVVSCPDCGKPLLWHLAHEHRCDKQPRKSKPAKPPMVRCAMCDESYPLHLAREHKCAQKSSPSKKSTTSPVTKTVASSVSSPSSRRIDTPPEPSVSTPVSTVSTPSRLTAWRAKNREAYNAYMRDWRKRQKAQK